MMSADIDNLTSNEKIEFEKNFVEHMTAYT